MKYLFLTLGVIALAIPALGTVTFDIQAEELRTSGGISAPTSTLVMLIVDTNNDGFGAFQAGASLSANTALNSGGDDRIIYKTNILSTSGTVGVFADFPTLDFTSITGWTSSPSDALALVWFPTLTTATLATTAGDSYGLFSGPALNGSDIWTTPADGSSGYKLYFFTSAATVLNPGGGHAASLGDASLAVVPEPSVPILALMGLASILLRRRRASNNP